MRLRRFAVKGLFGLFDHEVAFNLNDRITIIHAPNGYGKTVILKLIAGMFGGSMIIFRQHEFVEVIFEMDDGTVVRVVQTDRHPELFPRERPESQRFYSVSLHRSGETLEWDPTSNRSIQDLRRDISLGSVERYLPFLRREAVRLWRDVRSGDQLDFDTIIDLYSDRFPNSIRRSSPKHPDWLDEFRLSLSCQFIETQRLMIQRGQAASYEHDEAALTPTVKTYSQTLSALMGKALADSATLSQSLDRTFPNRLLRRMREAGAPTGEEELRRALTDLEQRRARLMRVDLLDKSEESAFIPGEAFDDPTRRILSEYVSDANKKLEGYNDLLSRIELFTDILSDRFKFKSVAADRTKGFILRDIQGRELQPDSLSSGEQHELVLMYDLLFKTRPNALWLIDEPEISLHIAWQRRFLDDLRRIIELNAMDIVLSTHSPQLIGENLELTVKLQGPRDVDGLG